MANCYLITDHWLRDYRSPDYRSPDYRSPFTWLPITDHLITDHWLRDYRSPITDHLVTSTFYPGQDGSNIHWRIIKDLPSVDIVNAPWLSVRNTSYPRFLYLFTTDGWGNLKLFFHPDDMITYSGLTLSRKDTALDVLLPWWGAIRTVLFKLSPAIARSSLSAPAIISPGNKNDFDPNSALTTRELLL